MENCNNEGEKMSSIQNEPKSRYCSYSIIWSPLLGGGCNFIGENKGQVINTLKYYNENYPDHKVHIPKIEEICENKEINLEACFSFCGNYWITAEVADGFKIHVNANAFDEFKSFTKESFLKRGDLYKFGLGLEGIVYVPEKIVDGIIAYDWKQHEELIKKYNEEFEDLFEKTNKECNYAAGRVVKKVSPKEWLLDIGKKIIKVKGQVLASMD